MSRPTKKAVLILLFSIALLPGYGGEVSFPRLGPNSRYLVNQTGTPLLLQADSPWSLMVALTREETTAYLADRQAKGFNAVVTQLIENQFGGVDNPYGSPRNRYGEGPFTTPGDFSTPNEAYFAHVDWVIQEAASHGMLLLANPGYLGYPGAGEGWYAEVISNGPAKCRDYGRWLGSRYKDTPNLVWVMFGDRNTDDSAPMIEAMIEGILEQDTNHLATAHMLRQSSSRDQLEDRSWLSVNSVYTADIPHVACLNAYVLTPVLPVFLFEAFYEGEHNMTPRQLRTQSYSALLSGACGQAFGNRPIWLFGAGWQAALDSEGSTSMIHVKNLFLSRSWHLLVPDLSHDVVTAGYGILGTTEYVSAARASDGSTVLAYLPVGHAVSVDLSSIPGASAKLWWFNPRDGASLNIGSFPSSGSQVLTPPDTDDWVLVIDDESRNLPPPGSEPLNLPPSADIGPDQFVPWPQNQTILSAAVNDDGKPVPPGATSLQWTVLNGPGSVEFTPANTASTVTVTFETAGSYLLRLEATDGDQTAHDEVKVVLGPNQAPSAPIRLLCQGLTNPTSVAAVSPTLSWTTVDADAGDFQSAYRIDLRDGTNGVVWDTGKILSTNNAAAYGGTALLPGRSYTWRVMTWDRFDAESDFSDAASFLLMERSGELLINGGFETGDTTGWLNEGGGNMVVGSAPPFGNKGPHSGASQAFWTSSSPNFRAYQEVDLSPYAGWIDAGRARLKATGWLVSNEYRAAPPYDQFSMQVRCLNGTGALLALGSYDSGVLNAPAWSQYGVEDFRVPPLTRKLRVLFNCWEDGYDGGSADDFSAELFLQALLIIYTQNLPAGLVGSDYSFQLEAIGGLAPFSWSLAPGSDPLPGGLELSSGGILRGLPTAAGLYNLSFRVTDAQGRSAYRTLPLTITIGPLQVLTSILGPGKRKVPYSTFLLSQGGEPPFNWTLVSAFSTLPTGIAIFTNGLLAGQPLTTGLYYFTVRVSDSLDSLAEKELSLRIDPVKITLGSSPQTQSQIATGGFEFWMNTDAPGSFAVDRSDNLVDWSQLLGIDHNGGLTNLADTNLSTAPRQFYRGRQP